MLDLNRFFNLFAISLGLACSSILMACSTPVALKPSRMAIVPVHSSNIAYTNTAYNNSANNNTLECLSGDCININSTLTYDAVEGSRLVKSISLSLQNKIIHTPLSLGQRLACERALRYLDSRRSYKAGEVMSYGTFFERRLKTGTISVKTQNNFFVRLEVVEFEIQNILINR